MLIVGLTPTSVDSMALKMSMTILTIEIPDCVSVRRLVSPLHTSLVSSDLTMSSLEMANRPPDPPPPINTTSEGEFWCLIINLLQRIVLYMSCVHSLFLMRFESYLSYSNQQEVSSNHPFSRDATQHCSSILHSL
jgi:hypothetical protein